MKMQKKEVEKLLGLKKSYIDYLIREKWVLPQKKGQFYNFSEEDTQSTINNIFLSVENIKSELNEELLFLRKQLKIINAQL